MISGVLSERNRKLLKTVITGKSQEIIDNMNKLLDNEFWQELHPSKWVSDFGLQDVAADFSSRLPWKFWRYPKGLEKPETYLNRPAAIPEDEPSDQNSKN